MKGVDIFMHVIVGLYVIHNTSVIKQSLTHPRLHVMGCVVPYHTLYNLLTLINDLAQQHRNNKNIATHTVYF